MEFYNEADFSLFHKRGCNFSTTAPSRGGLSIVTPRTEATTTTMRASSETTEPPRPRRPPLYLLHFYLLFFPPPLSTLLAQPVSLLARLAPPPMPRGQSGRSRCRCARRAAPLPIVLSARGGALWGVCACTRAAWRAARGRGRPTKRRRKEEQTPHPFRAAPAGEVVGGKVA